MAWWPHCRGPASSPAEAAALPEISLILVSHNMTRELPRTLRSLSSDYQRGISPGRCEIIVVDNGSTPPPVAAEFADLGLDLSVHHWSDPTPSPVPALNYGLSQARGALVGAWIDGARMASPGLVAACTEAAALHPRPVVATPNYELGRISQWMNAQQGYDAAEEDRLLGSIGWPRHAERLFEIAVPAWRNGIDGPMFESNALFMPRAMWEELGGYDPRFVTVGGGAANPDVLIRACELPAAQFIRVDGEATFHQVHGGAFYNAGESLAHRFKKGTREYWRIRHRPLAAVRQAPWIYSSATGRCDRRELDQ